MQRTSARSSRQFFWIFFLDAIAVQGANGTLQWHHIHSPEVGRHTGTAVARYTGGHSTLQWHPTMAPTNSTTSTAPCNGTLVPRPIRRSGSSPSLGIGRKNPYSYRYLGKNISNHPPDESHKNQPNWYPKTNSSQSQK